MKNSLSACEMFKELGYDKVFKNEWNIKYVKTIPENTIWDKKFEINFMIAGDNQFYKYDGKMIAVPITFKEYQAINKQIKELDWK